MADDVLFSMTGIEKSFGPVHVLKGTSKNV